MSKDLAFTRRLGEWLDNPAADQAEGALLLYKLRANPIEYRRISADPQKYSQYIRDQLKKFYDFRVSDTTHEQVVATVRKAENAVASMPEATVIAPSDSAIPKEPVRSGRRADHDTLPEEIRKCYDDNIELMRKIRDRHTKMRLIIQSKASCKDADLLPFAQDIISLDKKRLANWKKYDSYKA